MPFKFTESFSVFTVIFVLHFLSEFTKIQLLINGVGIGETEMQEFRKQKRSDGPGCQPVGPFGGNQNVGGGGMFQVFHLPRVTLPQKIQLKWLESLFFVLGKSGILLCVSENPQ